MDVNWEKTCSDCGECCGLVPFDALWFSLSRHRVQTEPVLLVPCHDKDNPCLIVPITSDMKCVFLTPENRCVVYEERPYICRLYGTIEKLQCPQKKIFL